MGVDLPARLAALDSWLAKNTPAIYSTLQPGATEAELSALEQHIGYKLPKDFRTLYKWHDGQKHPPGKYVGGAIVLDFISLEDVRSEWDVWKDLEADFQDFQDSEGHTSHPAGRIREQYINTGWVAFLVDGGGNSVGLDLNPGPAGVQGQIISFGRDENDNYVLADSLSAFINEYVHRLLSKRVYVVQPQRDDLVILLQAASGEFSHTYSPVAALFPGFGASPIP